MINEYIPPEKNEDFQKIIRFNQETNKFQYGLLKPGQTKIIKQNTTYEDYDKYWHLASPEQFVKQDGGICWDYVAYEADWFKKNLPSIRTHTYYIQFDNKKNCPTHTFLVFEYDGRYYWFESSFYAVQGIREADSIKDIINAVMYYMNKYPKDNNLLSCYFEIREFNPLDKSLIGLGCQQYMDYIWNHGIKVSHKYSPNFNVTKIKEFVNEAAFSINSIDHTKSVNVVKAVLDKLSETQREHVLGDQSIEKPCLILVVAYNGKDPVGYCKVNSKKNYDGYGYIELAVVPIYQRRGIGRQLVSKAISETRAQYKDIKLMWTTTIDNEASMKAANKCGFKQVNANAGSNIRRYMYTEACKDIATARQFVSDVGKLAKKYDANYFIVTDGASGIHNDGNAAVRNARQAQIEWEKKNGGDPDEDWSKQSTNESYLLDSYDTTRNLAGFIGGKLNKLMILGFSGAGKSAVAADMAKRWHATHIGMNLLIRGLKTNCKLVDKWLNDYVKDHKFETFADMADDAQKNDKVDELQKDIVTKFIDFIETRPNTDRYVIDSIWPLVYDIPPERFEHWGVMILGTSYIKATWLNCVRSTDSFIGRFKALFSRLTPSNVKKYGINVQRNIDKYLDYFQDHHEEAASILEGWRAELPDSAFGIPEERKFPLNDAHHVRSAIHLFGHAPAGKKKALARRISRAASRYGIKIPETTQVYKALHESNTMEYYTFGPGAKDYANYDDMLTVYTTTEVRNMPMSRIKAWYIGPDRYINNIPSPWYCRSYIDALRQYSFNDPQADKRSVAYVYVPANALLLKDGEPVPDGIPNIIIGIIATGEEYYDKESRWVEQFPIRVMQDGMLCPCYDESAICAMVNVNPVIGMAGQLHYLIGTNSNRDSKRFVYANDPNSEKGIVINDNGYLEAINCANLTIPDCSYRYIGPSINLEKMADLYARNEVVLESNLYSLLSGKELYSEDQIDFDPNFRKVDLDLLECRLETSTATLMQGYLEALGSTDMIGLDILDESTIPDYVEKYNTLNDIVIREDVDGYYYYSTLSHKRTPSVHEMDELSENMLISVL